MSGLVVVFSTVMFVQMIVLTVYCRLYYYVT